MIETKDAHKTTSVRKTASGLFALAIFALSAAPVSAHPLDVSASSMTVEGNSVVATTALHPSEVERIL